MYKVMKEKKSLLVFDSSPLQNLQRTHRFQKYVNFVEFLQIIKVIPIEARADRRTYAREARL